MAYTAPNSFTAGTVIEAEKMQENVDALKKYINGGSNILDISLSTEWANTKHFMKGLYNPIDNSYEMTNGFYKGPALSDMPAWHPGYGGKFLGDLGVVIPEPIPGTAITFYLDHPADVVYFKADLSPRGLPLNPGDVQFELSTSFDGAGDSYSRMFGSKETDLEEYAGPPDILIGLYRRRYYQTHSVFTNVSSGYHTINLRCRSDLRAVALKFYTYSIQAYYQVV